MSSGMQGARRRIAAIVLTLAVASVALVAATGPASAQDSGGEYCLTDDPPPPEAPPNRLRFGNTPLEAGSAGAVQADPVPHDQDKDLALAQDLRPSGKELVMRLNRMFWADGREGVERYAAIVDHYAKEGFSSELQVRYHPPEGEEGDMAAWEEYVRMAVRILGQREALSGLSITNEANFTASPNTSDGSYEGVREAIVVGTLAARDELDEMGRQDVELGFSFAWRWQPGSDREFWEDLGRLGSPEFVAATDYVGLQVYPDRVWPTVDLPDRTAGEEVVEALHLLRNCYMPKADLGGVDLWITENGYGTNLDDTVPEQDRKLQSTVEAVHRWSGTLNVTDYRWFNLRDNDTDGTGLFSAVGLARDDYSLKPAFCTMYDLIAQYGTDGAHPPPDAASPCAATREPGAGSGDDGDGGRPGDGGADDDGAPSSGADRAASRGMPATGGGLAAFGLALLATVAAVRRRTS